MMLRRWTDHHYISFSQQTYSNHNFVFNSILIPSRLLFFTSAPFRWIWIQPQRTPINLRPHTTFATITAKKVFGKLSPLCFRLLSWLLSISSQFLSRLHMSPSGIFLSQMDLISRLHMSSYNLLANLVNNHHVRTSFSFSSLFGIYKNKLTEIVENFFVWQEKVMFLLCLN